MCTTKEKKTVEIIPWDDAYAQNFIDLSIEWLEKYVSVEPADIEIIYHPHESILDDGGMIFFAKYSEEIVGTVGMIKVGDTFELVKLAVTEKYKGLKIGHLLIERAIQFAKDQQVKKVYLFTNHKLLPAIHLYHKYGFYDVPLIDNEYIESDMKMDLDL